MKAKINIRIWSLLYINDLEPSKSQNIVTWEIIEYYFVLKHTPKKFKAKGSHNW
jgi:hypothetical protein